MLVGEVSEGALNCGPNEQPFERHAIVLGIEQCIPVIKRSKKKRQINDQELKVGESTCVHLFLWVADPFFSSFLDNLFLLGHEGGPGGEVSGEAHGGAVSVSEVDIRCGTE